MAVAGAERDRKKFTAAQSWGSSNRIDVMKRIVKKFKQFPDRLVSNREVERFNTEAKILVDEFCNVPFNGSYQSLDAKRLIDLWEENIQGKYSGFTYQLLRDEMACIVTQYKSRVN